MLTNKIEIKLDLDLTIWESRDRYGNMIWAKQLVPPFTRSNDDELTDDVGSTCTLKTGVRKFLEQCSEKALRLTYITNGAYFGLPDEYQPCELVLKALDIRQHFGRENQIFYKSVEKWKHLEPERMKMTDISVYFFDDNDLILSHARKIEGLHVIDSKSISDWSEMLTVLKIDPLISK